jgi:hypothetical protein
MTLRECTYNLKIILNWFSNLSAAPIAKGMDTQKLSPYDVLPSGFYISTRRHMDFHIFYRAKMLTRVLQRASTNNFSPIYNSVSTRNYF